MVPLPLCVKRPIKSQCQRLPSGTRAPLARSLESLEFEPDLEKVLRAQEQRYLQPNYVPGVTKFLPITAESALLKAQGHVRASDLPRVLRHSCPHPRPARLWLAGIVTLNLEASVGPRSSPGLNLNFCVPQSPAAVKNTCIFPGGCQKGHCLLGPQSPQPLNTHTHFSASVPAQPV